MKKLTQLTAKALLVALLAIPQTSWAYGTTWIDRDFDFDKVKNIVILPVGENAPEAAETNLLKESKRLKATCSLMAAYALENGNNEAERAQNIKTKTGADAYLVTQIVTNDVRTDYVEERTFPVTMHEYTEVEGPKGTHIEHEYYYDTYYTIPAHNVNLNNTEVDFYLYDANTGKAIFSFNDVRHAYNHDHKSQFQDIAKELFISLRDTPKQAEKTRDRVINIKELTLDSQSENADILENGLCSELLIGGNKVKKISFPQKPEGDFELVARVAGYEDQAVWVDPSISTSETLVNSWSEKIRVPGDSNGPKDSQGRPLDKEETIYHRTYRTSVSETAGGYSFNSNVSLSVHVIDSKTGLAAFTYANTKNNDKKSDAWRSLVKDFYNKLNKAMKTE